MTREDIFRSIEAERVYQNTKWGSEFDAKNTMNDWISYITRYAGQAVVFNKDNKVTFRDNLFKVAALAVAALEQEDYADRHYDE